MSLQLKRVKAFVDLINTNRSIQLEDSLLMADDLAALLSEIDSLQSQLKESQDRVKVLEECLKFFAEPYTWSRVWADRDHDEIGSGLLNNMYGSMARAALKDSEK